MCRRWLLLGALVGLPPAAVVAQAPAAAAARVLAPDDLFRLREVSDPQVSPDGGWVAYTVTVADTSEDKRASAVWMTSWDGARTVRLTTSKAGEHAPRWSPDGRFLAFLSNRDDEHTQLWLLDRLGGEGAKLTAFPGDVEDYVWAPDGTRLALVVADGDTAKGKTPRPIVIDRFQFKADEVGYLGRERRHLYLVDVATRRATILTPGDYDELLPAWSPDGTVLAFVSKRRPDFDRDNNWDLYVMDAVPGATPRQLTTFAGPDNDPDTESRPAWSPDGRFIAYLEGGPLSLVYYAVQKLAVVPAAGGPPRILTAALDRSVAKPAWTADGSALLFLLEDDRAVALARVPAAGGVVTRLVSVPRVVEAFATGPDGQIAALVATPRAGRSVRARRRRGGRGGDAAPAVAPERRVARRRAARRGRADRFPEQGRHRGARVPRDAARLSRRHALPHPAAHPRRAGFAVRLRVRFPIAAVRGAGLRGGGGQPARQLGPRGALCDRHLRGVGGEGRAGRPRRGGLRGGAGRRRSRPAGRRGVELRRDTHQLRDRPGPAVQGRGERGLHLEHPGRLRHGSIRARVRGRARAAVAEHGDVAPALVPLPPRRPHRDAHAVPVRRQGFQRAAPQLGADVPGAAQPRRPDRARDLPGPVSRHHPAELRARSAGALPGVVRPLPQAVAAPTPMPRAPAAGWDGSSGPLWRSAAPRRAPRRR